MNIYKICIFFVILFNNLSCENFKIKEKKAIICGVVKNGAGTFFSAASQIVKIEELFGKTRVFVYEDNSRDNTKQLYKMWSKKKRNLTFLCEDFPIENLIKKQFQVGDWRTQCIANARNKVLFKALSSDFYDFDYMIMLDLDEFEDFNTEKIKEILENPCKDWDALFANGSYDLYALRSKEFPLGPESIGWSEWQNELNNIGRDLGLKLKNEEWIKVDSAFGGMAIYKIDSLRGCSYSGLVGELVLENIEKYLKDGFFDNFDEYKPMIINNLSTMRAYIKKNGVKNLPFYTCEHINLHLMMKKNGKDGLFVVPKLIRRSKTHKNYY